MRWLNAILSFQFHKVQLKVETRSHEQTYAQFQFHKVQLKALSLFERGVFYGFQFHKVQLKVEQVHQPKRFI